LRSSKFITGSRVVREDNQSKYSDNQPAHILEKPVSIASYVVS